MPIFQDALLSTHLNEFKIDHVPRINQSKEIINSWIKELESGKLRFEKEESIKSRFILEFFGDILGFNYGNSKLWHLREEVKTVVDGKKPDGALGFFESSKDRKQIQNDVRVVIEMKGFNVDLDKEQASHKKKLSPVEQAFYYATGMGGKTSWVIVSNMKETRIYDARDRSKYESFFLVDLTKPEVLKRLIYLFHIDRFLHEEKSHTDKLLILNSRIVSESETNTHIVDQIYNCLMKFDKLQYIDPNILCNIKPFTILEEHVWHYEEGELFTLNEDIYNLISRITITDDTLSFDESLENELLHAKVERPIDKLTYVFRKFNQCGIIQVSGVKSLSAIEKRNRNTIGFSHRHIFDFQENDGVKLNINIRRTDKCNCTSCTFRELKIDQLISRLNSIDPESSMTLEVAYGHYLLSTDNYKKAFIIYKGIREKTKGVEGSEITYFLASYNMLYLHNLIQGHYAGDDRDSILKEIRSIDLDKIIWDELTPGLDSDVRKVLVKIKEHTVSERISKISKECLDQTNLIKERYKERYESMFSGSNKLEEIRWCMVHLYHFVNFDYLISNVFSNHIEILQNLTKSMVNSFLSTHYKWKLQEFPDFYIQEAILGFNGQDMAKVFNEVDSLTINKQAHDSLLERTENFFKSFYTSHSWSTVANTSIESYLANWDFKRMVEDTFFNIFTILSKVSVDKDSFKNKCATPIMYFFEVDLDCIYWVQMECFGKFLVKKGDLFTVEQLEKLLFLCIQRNRININTQSKLIPFLIDSINQFYPEYRMSNKGMVLKAISDCYDSSNKPRDLRSLIPYWKIVDDEMKTLIQKEFDSYLHDDFDLTLYEELLRNRVIKHDYQDYLKRYISSFNPKSYISIAEENGEPAFNCGFTVSNFLWSIYYLDIPMDDPRLSVLEWLPPHEKWLMNPFKFDYVNFNPKWLKLANRDFIFDKIRSIDIIGKMTYQHLQTEFDPELSQIYFKHFSD